MLDDPEYFNTVPYDEAVNAVVHVMQVADALYRENERRDDELELASTYSASSGLHMPAWEGDAWKDFVERYNVHIDHIRTCRHHLSQARVAAKENKDKARSLQWLPAVHFLDSSLHFLVELAGIDNADTVDGEALVRSIAALADDKLQEKTCQERVACKYSKASAQIAGKLAAHCETSYTLLVNAPSIILEFKHSRQALSGLPEVTPSWALHHIMNTTFGYDTLDLVVAYQDFAF